MKTIRKFSGVVFLLIAILTNHSALGQNAPITTAGSISVCPNGTVSVPVTVTNFTQITAVSLRLDINPTLLDYTGYSNLNSSLSGCLVNAITVSSTLKKIIIVWSDVTPLTLSNGSKLIDLNFTLLSGSPIVAFNNDANGGSDCEYADAIGDPLNDIPTSTYYINASVTNMGVGAAGTITGTSTVCQAQSAVAYSVGAIANASNYTWAYSGTGATINGSTNIITINFAANATSGNLTVMGTNSCGNGTLSANFPITVNPLPSTAGTITGTGTVCQGQNAVAYTVGSIANATTYTWAYSGTGATINGTTNNITINFASNATSGNLTVMGTNTCGNGTISANFPVTVNAFPATAGTITGVASVCQSQNAVPYSVGSIANATSYTWAYSGTGATINGTTNSITINFAANATSGNLTVMGTNSCGNGTISANFPITVNPLPAAAGAITGSATVCQAQSAVAYSVGAIANASSYTWVYSGTGATVNGTTNSITINFAANATSGNLTVMGTNSCGNGTLSANFPITVNPLPSTAGTITGTGTVCQGQNAVAYTVGSIANATTYTWAYSGTGATINGTTNNITINFASNATSGNLTVMGTNTCGNGTISANFPVTVNAFPATAGTITGVASVCQSQNAVPYSVGSIANATSYTWAYSGTGATINGTTNSITINFAANATSGNLTVMGTNSCGNGTISANFPITVNQLPTADAGIDQSIPNGSSTTLNGSATGGSGSYTWHWEPAYLLLDPNVQNPTTVNLTASVLFTLSVTDANACNDNDDVFINVSGPLTVFASATPDTICAGEMVQLMASAGGGTGSYSFSWTSVPEGFTSDLQNPVAYPTLSTVYTVAVDDGTNIVTSNVNVTVNPLPEIPAIPEGPDSVDLRVIESSDYIINSITSNDSYIWELSPVTAGNISGTDTIGTVIWNTNYLGFAFIRVKSVNSCGQSQFSNEKQTFVDNTTSINDPSLSNVVIYPNPNDGSFWISSSEKITKVTLYNGTGKRLKEIHQPDKNFLFKNKLPDGTYFVEVQIKKKVFLKKIVVKNVL